MQVSLSDQQQKAIGKGKEWVFTNNSSDFAAVYKIPDDKFSQVQTDQMQGIAPQRFEAELAAEFESFHIDGEVPISAAQAEATPSFCGMSLFDNVLLPKHKLDDKKPPPCFARNPQASTMALPFLGDAVRTCNANASCLGPLCEVNGHSV